MTAKYQRVRELGIRVSRVGLMRTIGVLAMIVAMQAGCTVVADDGGAAKGQVPPTSAQAGELSAVVDDPCNATIVTTDGSMTARDLCNMIADSGKNVTVFHSQCYGGDVAICCNGAGGGSGCHNSGGSSGELQYYGEYDQGTADAMKPGATSAGVHQSGADNTSSSTPIDGKCSSKLGSGDTVITFAGDPNGRDHDMAQQIDGQNANTVVLEGDGSAGGVDGAATAKELEDAIKNAGSNNVWIWISDHGNKGGPTTSAVTPTGGTSDLILTIDPITLDHMASDYGDTAWIFLDSPSPFPDMIEVIFNGEMYPIAGSDAYLVDHGGAPFFRYLLAVPEFTVMESNHMVVNNLTGPDFLLEAFVDSGPIAKIGFFDPVPPDGEPLPGGEGAP